MKNDTGGLSDYMTKVRRKSQMNSIDHLAITLCHIQSHTHVSVMNPSSVSFPNGICSGSRSASSNCVPMLWYRVPIRCYLKTAGVSNPAILTIHYSQKYFRSGGIVCDLTFCQQLFSLDSRSCGRRRDNVLSPLQRKQCRKDDRSRPTGWVVLVKASWL